MRSLLMLALLGSLSGAAETYSVCDVLGKLSELNGKTIVIRGVWAKGDVAQSIHPPRPCEKSTIRDGWLFMDGIEATPRDGKASVAIEVTQLRDFSKNHPNGWAVATMTGRLETREIFNVRQRYYDTVPEAFRFWPARLNYWKVNHFESVPYDKDEYETYWLPWSKSPDPRRMPSTFPYTARP